MAAASSDAAAAATAVVDTAPEDGDSELAKAEQIKREEEKLMKLYGHVPSAKPKLKGRKWFDSGEYELSKKNPNRSEPMGVGIPEPGKIPHSVPKSNPSKPSESKPSSLHASTASD